MSSSGGCKYDGGKNRLDLLPVYPLWEIARVYTFGANKYADENWRAGISYKRIYGAILRHLLRWFSGETLDEESGLSHLAHAAWGCITLLEYSKTHPSLDDRPKGAGI